MAFAYDPVVLAKEEATLILSSFTSNTAFDLGIRLRDHIQKTYPTNTNVVIQITAGVSDQLYFFATCGEGSTMDNASWISRKKNSVARWGVSTASLRVKYAAGVPEKYNTSEKEFAVHGGGFPLRVKGVEPLVGIVIVSGLEQQQDHQVIVDTLKILVDEQNAASK